MIMQAISRLFSIGTDYRMASVAARAKIGVSADVAAVRLRQLTADIAREAAIISTCNRTEIYCVTEQPQEVARWLGGGHECAMFQLNARAAARRAFCVASGIESQIIGEPEITGQIKQAAQIARESGASGVFVNRLLEKSLAAAKAVRHQTAIGRNSVSYCGLVARAAAGVFSDFADIAVLFVGIGGMTRSGMPIFAGRGARRLAVANRTLDGAEQLAQRYGGEAIMLARLPEVLGEFDVIISSTASPLPLIGKGAVEHALSVRRRPMLFADLGVPRDLEPEISELPDAFVYTLAQLGEQAEQSQIARQEAALMANEIIDHHVDEFCLWWERRNLPELRAPPPAVTENFRRQQTEEALARLQRGEDARAVVEGLSRRLSRKIPVVGGGNNDDSSGGE